MTYEPHLIAQYSTALDKSLQPWLLPDEAQAELYDGYVYRGTWQKREGYEYYANGRRGGAPYCESRIVVKVTAAAMSGVIDSVNKTFTLAATGPIQRGTFVVTGTTPAQTVTDNGLGGFPGGIVGTINYTTGAVSITLAAAPTAGTVTATYNYHAGLPVMMVASFYGNDGSRQLIVADTRNVNKYNPLTNRLDPLATPSVYTGVNTNFWSWVNYADIDDLARMLFVNGKDPIQSYDGSAITTYAPTFPIVDPANPITAMSCLQMFQLKDRLILLRTIETTTVIPSVTEYTRRIRISGTGQSCDDFSSAATGAGSIEIPDDTPIIGGAYNKDDLIIFTESSVWTLKYTGNDVVPFVLYRLDDTRGSNAPFSAISYLGRTSAAGKRGLIMTNGDKVERMDDKLPDYSYNEINQGSEIFKLCFAGTVDEDRDHYLIHPSPYSTTSDRILVTNYEEDNFAVYRIPLSCMGSYRESFNVVWNDLLVFENWDQFAANYSNWLSFGYAEGTPLAIGGGHKGEIWKMNLIGSEDNQVKIYGITIIDNQTIEVTTDWNNFSLNTQDGTLGADVICIEGVEGMTNVNHRQYAITEIIDNYTFRLRTLSATGYQVTGTWTSGGTAARVIPFESKTKQFNPYSASDRQVRCGWLYFYLTISGTSLTANDPDDLTQEIPVPAQIKVEIYTNDSETPTQIIYVPGYLSNSTNLSTEIGAKKWNKIWINQTARFIQFKVTSLQAGANIKIQAMMPGFKPTGRMI